MTLDAQLLGLESDAEGSRIVSEELALLGAVQRALSAAEKKASAHADVPEDDALIAIRDEIAVAKPEDLPALLEQMHHMGALRAQRGRGTVGLLDQASPYFGHLRLEEYVSGQKTPRRRDILVGARSYVDASAGVRIVDWKNAPVSRIFYRYREGDDFEERLGDTQVEGTVMVRRSVAIVGGELRRVTAPEGTFLRDEAGRWRRLEATTSRLHTSGSRLGSTDGRDAKLLPEIASMLDRAQYEIITRETRGLLAIQGSAGSGKTTVGLHRVAFLAAQNATQFRPDRMMVVVPNEALIHYTSRVLPSLGVEGVGISTFLRFARRAVMTMFPDLPTLLRDDTPPLVSRLKSSPRMLVALDRLVSELDARLDARAQELLAKWEGGDIVLRAFAATKGLAPDQRVTRLAQWAAGKRELAASKGQDVPAITRPVLERLGQELRKKTRALIPMFEDLLTDKARLSEAFQSEAPHDGATRHGFVQHASFGQLAQLHDWCVRQARVRAEGERDGEQPSLDEEDLALLLRLWQRVRGPLLDSAEQPIELAHVFVDEVQDSSPVELRVLLDMVGKDRPVTLAGDVAQRMLRDDDERGEFQWHDLLADLGFEASTVEPLAVSYRSTAEITSFARGVLGPFAHDAEPIASRHGPPVLAFEFASVGESVAFLADALKDLAASEPDANVAVIARFAQQADVVYAGLERAEVPRLRRVAKQDFSWEAGVDVTDVRQTKGLEFDEVVLVETTKESYPEAPPARHALYVGATRAAHQLWCLAAGTQSPLVAAGLAAQGGAGAEATSVVS
jgi:DNA helicase-2/ATP-dependent DNA helicase PcrA